MAFLALRCLTAWTEDRATQRCDPSAVPGAETEGRADAVRSAARPYQPLRDRHESDKPSRQDAATRPAGCISRFANARRPKFQFTLNQYTPLRAADGDDTLRYYLSKAPLVVSGEIIELHGDITSGSQVLIDYSVTLRISQVLKGAEDRKEISASVRCFKQNSADHPESLKKNRRVILFLRHGVAAHGEPNGLICVDAWFSVQPASEVLERSLARLAAASTSEPEPKPVEVRDSGNATLGYYKSKASLVVSGEIVKSSPAIFADDSTCTRSLRVKVTKIMRGGVQGDEITARVVRFEKDETEAPAFLKEGKRVILFLREQGDGYQTVDPWFGVQQYNSVMEEEIDSTYAKKEGKP